MNTHSKRAWRVLLAGTAVVTGACGGGSGGATATDKAGWTKAHGAAVTAVSTDVDTANGALDKGDRPVILSSCNQLQEDLADARKGLPVPDAAADGALRAGLDAVAAAVPTCLDGARTASDAKIVEQSQRDMKAARTKMDEADKALAAWP